MLVRYIKIRIYDMRQYKRLQMFVHAENLMNDNTNLQDNQLSCFVRLGSDMVNNYYAYMPDNGNLPFSLMGDGATVQETTPDF